MKILPMTITNITYKTQLSVNEVIKRLNDCVEPKKGFSLFSVVAGRGKLYEGEISGQTFEVSRIINYRNSFLPVIIGNIQQENNTTIIEINMKLHMLANVFLFILGIFFFYRTCLLLFYMMFVIMSFILFGVFEVYKAKTDFQQIFEAEIIEEK